jgi:periplasmic divalent cation tolerance protein
MARMPEPQSSRSAPSARLVLITAPDLETARRLARELVESRAAACANLVPGLTSIYRWQGAVQEDAEVLMVVKSSAERLPELERIVARVHPYEVPEIVALQPADVEGRYLSWWLGQTAPE